MNDESTRLLIDEDENNMNQPVAPAPEAAAPQEYTQPQAAPKATRQGVGAGVVAAAAGLAAAAGAAVGTVTPYVIAAAVIDDETAEEATVETTDSTGADTANTTAATTTVGATTVNGMHVAHVDASSFSEAFSEARAQVGPGGVFEYNGNVYGTYYANEWNAMSPSEQAAFTRNAMAANAADHAAAAEVTESPAVTDAPAATENVIMAEAVDADPTVRVLGVEDVPLDNGDIATAIITTVDDTPAVFVDIDNDDVIDAVVFPPTPDEILANDGRGGPEELFLTQDNYDDTFDPLEDLEPDDFNLI